MFVAAAFLGASVLAAAAADLPTHKQAPAPAPFIEPAFSWTGFYGGLNAGYADPTASLGVSPADGWVGDPDWGFTSAAQPGVAAISSHKFGLNGFIGGGQVGFNYQISNFVIGLEADADYMHLGGSYSTPTYNGVNGGTYNASGSASVDSLVTVRGRAGVSFGQLLAFVTGGVAFTNEHFSQSIGFSNVGQEVPRLPVTPTAANGYNAGSASSLIATGVLGGGLEYAFDRHWSVAGEYLYVPLKSLSFTSTYVDATNTTFTVRHHDSLSALNVFRVGLNYRF